MNVPTDCEHAVGRAVHGTRDPDVPVGLPDRGRPGGRRRVDPDARRRAATTPRPGSILRSRRCARQRLRADRPGLHDGLRHPAHDQLRPRRDLHGRHVRGYFTAVGLAERRASSTAGPLASAVCRSLIMMRGRRRGRDRDCAPGRADRLPAPAERAAARAADQRDRRVVLPAVLVPRASSAPASTPTRRSPSSRAGPHPVPQHPVGRGARDRRRRSR